MATATEVHLHFDPSSSTSSSSTSSVSASSSPSLPPTSSSTTSTSSPVSPRSLVASTSSPGSISSSSSASSISSSSTTRSTGETTPLLRNISYAKGGGGGAGPLAASTSSSIPTTGTGTRVDPSPLLSSSSPPPGPSSIATSPGTGTTGGGGGATEYTVSGSGTVSRVGEGDREEEDDAGGPAGRSYLDLFLPDPTTIPTGKLAPVLIYVHGGGWQRGSKDSEMRGGPPVGRTCARHGIVVASLSYRLAPSSSFSLALRSMWATVATALILGWVPFFRDRWDRIGPMIAIAWVTYFALFQLRRWCDKGTVRHPEQIRDVARAVAWINAHLKEHFPQSDMSKVFISGHSAGAHLATLLALDHQWLQAESVHPSFFKGAIAISGVYTVDGPMNNTTCFGQCQNCVFRMMYTRPAFGSSSATWRSSSPMSHVRSVPISSFSSSPTTDSSPSPTMSPSPSFSGIVPSLVSSPSGSPSSSLIGLTPMAADYDQLHWLVLNASADIGLEADGERLVARFRSLGIPVEYEIIPNCTHASIVWKFSECSAHRSVIDFVHRRSEQLERLQALRPTSPSTSSPTPTTSSTSIALPIAPFSS